MIRTLLFAALISATVPALAAPRTGAHESPTIILVHGAFADGASWDKVVHKLDAWHAPTVTVELPLTSLRDDVEATRRAIRAAPGKVVLVGHSWGGTVITQAGGDDKVGALVYVAGFAPDVGQDTAQQGKDFPTPPGMVSGPDDAGLLWLTEKTFADDFAQDRGAREIRHLFDTQRPIQASAFAEPVTDAAWKRKPSWYVVTRMDRMIAPQLQTATAWRIGAQLRSLSSSHVAMLSQPTEVAHVILEAAGLKQADPAPHEEG